MSKLCVNCGHTLNDDDLFCNKCGFRMSEGSPANIRPANCTLCGSALRESSEFCGRCGASKNGTPSKYKINGPATGKSYQFTTSSSPKGLSDIVFGREVSFSFKNYYLEIKIPKKYNADIFCIKYTDVQSISFKRGFSIISLAFCLICVIFVITSLTKSEYELYPIIIAAVAAAGAFLGSFQTNAIFTFDDDSKQKFKLRKIRKKKRDDVQNIIDYVNEMKNFYIGKQEPSYISAFRNCGIRQVEFDISGIAKDIMNRFSE